MDYFKDKFIVKITSGLGNQMFAFAFSKALEKTGKTIVYETSYYNSKKSLKQDRPFYLDKLFDLDSNLFNSEISKKAFKLEVGPFIVRIINKIIKRLFGYKIVRDGPTVIIHQNGTEKIDYFQEYSSAYLIGWWGGEKYFENILNEINDIFKFKNIQDKEISNVADSIITTSNNASLHWRRGDFLGGDKDLKLDNYFVNSINYLVEKKDVSKFFIFSDDPKWVNEYFSDKFKDIEFINISELLITKPDYYELYLMTLCENNIISNSTFSWWGAYLNQNKNKIVIHPELWSFNETSIRGKQIYPASWISQKI